MVPMSPYPLGQTVIGSRQAEQQALGTRGRRLACIGTRLFSEITPVSSSGLARHLMPPAVAAAPAAPYLKEYQYIADRPKALVTPAAIGG